MAILLLSLAKDGFELFLKLTLNNLYQFFVPHLKLLQPSGQFQVLRLILIEIFFIPLPLPNYALPEYGHTLAEGQNKVGQPINFILVGLIFALVTRNLKGHDLFLLILCYNA